MEDVTRKRILRKLEQLPEQQLYQILDFIEFLELKYAREANRAPDAFQQFAERLEDQMRVRSLAPKAMKGTMKVVSTAGKMIDGVRTFGKELVTPTRTGTSVEGEGGGSSRDTVESPSGQGQDSVAVGAKRPGSGRSDSEPGEPSGSSRAEPGGQSAEDATGGTRAG